MGEQATADAKAQPANIFQPLGESAKAGAMQDFDMILDIPVQMTVELGRTKISIRNLLQLAHGSVVELDALAGEPMDVLINGTLIAQGEVEVYRDGQRVARLGAGTSVGEMAYLAPSPDLRVHSTDILVTEPATTISFTPEAMDRLGPSTRHLFDAAFIHVLVRRLHAAHEQLAHPRRIL